MRFRFLYTLHCRIFILFVNSIFYNLSSINVYQQHMPSKKQEH